MAVSIESFLVLEQSLATRITNAWTRDTATTRRKIIEAVNAGDFATAVDLCDGLGLGAAAERNRKYAEFVGMQALLYGASRLSGGNPKRTVFSGKRKPEEVEQATEILMQTLADSGTLAVCRLADELLLRERANQQDEAYKSERRKAATSGFIRGFQSAVNSNGKAYINIGSSLHNSRLSAWGFTQEANFRGISEYQVSEQLDSRTCPVCQAMNGRKFTVAPAQQKLEKWLGTTDAKELASIAKWPSQSKANVAAMRGMSSDQLAQRGWDTPPYHPLCRGVLVPAGTLRVTRPIPQERPVDAPEEVTQVPLPAVEEVVEDVAAVQYTQADVDRALELARRESASGSADEVREKATRKLQRNYLEEDANRIISHQGMDFDEAERLLTVDERAMLHSYTGSAYQAINGHIGGWQAARSAEAIEAIESATKVIDAGLAKLPRWNSNERGVSFRGMTLNSETVDYFRGTHTVGSEVSYGYFMSSATEKGAAFGGNVNLAIHGRSGRSITGFSQYGYAEREVLFRPGAKFRVLDIEDTGTRLNITLEEIEQVGLMEVAKYELSATQQAIVNSARADFEAVADATEPWDPTGEWLKKTYMGVPR